MVLREWLRRLPLSSWFRFVIALILILASPTLFQIHEEIAFELLEAPGQNIALFINCGAGMSLMLLLILWGMLGPGSSLFRLGVLFVFQICALVAWDLFWFQINHGSFRFEELHEYDLALLAAISFPIVSIQLVLALGRLITRASFLKANRYERPNRHSGILETLYAIACLGLMQFLARNDLELCKRELAEMFEGLGIYFVAYVLAWVPALLYRSSRNLSPIKITGGYFLLMVAANILLSTLIRVLGWHQDSDSLLMANALGNMLTGAVIACFCFLITRRLRRRDWVLHSAQFDVPFKSSIKDEQPRRFELSRLVPKIVGVLCLAIVILGAFWLNSKYNFRVFMRSKAGHRLVQAELAACVPAYFNSRDGVWRLLEIRSDEPIDAKRLVRVSKRCETIERIEIQSEMVTPEVLNALLAFPQLEELKIYETGKAEEGVPLVPSANLKKVFFYGDNKEILWQLLSSASLEELDLRADEVDHHTARLIEQHRSLTRLRLRTEDVGPSMIARLEKLPNLIELTIEDSYLESDELLAVRKLPEIRTLEIRSYDRIDGRAISALEGWSDLKLLILHSPSVSDGQLAEFMESAADDLVLLDRGRNKGLSEFRKLLIETNGDLEKAIVYRSSYYYLGDEDELVGFGISEPGLTVEDLRLMLSGQSYLDLSFHWDAPAHYLTQHLSSHDRLTSFRMIASEISDIDLERISDCPRLEELVLEECYPPLDHVASLSSSRVLTASGFEHLINARRLNSLGIGKLCREPMVYETLTKLNQIQHLKLIDTDLPKPVRDAVSEMVQLSALSLIECQVSQEELDWIGSQTRFRFVDLRQSTVGGRGTAYLDQWDHIEQFGLAKNQLDPESLKKIAQFPQLRTIALPAFEGDTIGDVDILKESKSISSLALSSHSKYDEELVSLIVEWPQLSNIILDYRSRNEWGTLIRKLRVARPDLRVRAMR